MTHNTASTKLCTPVLLKEVSTKLAFLSNSFSPQARVKFYGAHLNNEELIYPGHINTHID